MTRWKKSHKKLRPWEIAITGGKAGGSNVYCFLLLYIFIIIIGIIISFKKFEKKVKLSDSRIWIWKRVSFMVFKMQNCGIPIMNAALQVFYINELKPKAYLDHCYCELFQLRWVHHRILKKTKILLASDVKLFISVISNWSVTLHQKFPSYTASGQVYVYNRITFSKLRFSVIELLLATKVLSQL